MSAKSRAGRSSAGGSSAPRGRRKPRLVGAGLAVGEVGGVPHARQPRHLEGRVGELLAMDQHHGGRIVADELELGHRQPPVQRQEDRPQPPAGELQLEDVGVVHAEHRHAVAAANAEGGGQPKCCTRDALVELGVGEAPAGRQIVRRLRARREARVMADPVLHRNTRNHPFPLLFIGGASDRRRILSIAAGAVRLHIKRRALMAGGARLQSRVFVDTEEDRATGVARPQQIR